jgi:hypothetical protein
VLTQPDQPSDCKTALGGGIRYVKHARGRTGCYPGVRSIMTGVPVFAAGVWREPRSKPRLMPKAIGGQQSFVPMATELNRADRYAQKSQL